MKSTRQDCAGHAHERSKLAGTPTPALLQIVPRFDSAPSGVVDYALGIADGLVQKTGTHSVFLSGTPQATGDCPRRSDACFSVAQRSTSALCQALDDASATTHFTTILLHVSGYGYARRGAPLWLAAGLERWLREHRDVRVVAVMHELFASGKPWQSSFWFGHLQGHVSRRLWSLSSGGLTTTTRYTDQLLAWRPQMRPDLRQMPVISTVGEPDLVTDFAKRAATAVVFASPGVEDVLYQGHATSIEKAITVLGVKEIIDLGGRRRPPPSQIAGVPVKAFGRQSAEEISQHLGKARWGFMTYDLSRLGKSTVFAAYAAHGAVPVCFGSDSDFDGLVPDQHFLCNPSKPISDAVHHGIQSKARAWYAQHDSERLFHAVAELCQLTIPVQGELGLATQPKRTVEK